MTDITVHFVAQCSLLLPLHVLVEAGDANGQNEVDNIDSAQYRTDDNASGTKSGYVELFDGFSFNVPLDLYPTGMNSGYVEH